MAKGKRGKKQTGSENATSPLSIMGDNSQKDSAVVPPEAYSTANNEHAGSATTESTSANSEYATKYPLTNLPDSSIKDSESQIPNGGDGDADASKSSVAWRTPTSESNEDLHRSIVPPKTEENGKAELVDDDFHFGEQQSTSNKVDDDEDDDFGSFDEASFEEADPVDEYLKERDFPPVNSPDDPQITVAKISRTLDYLFPLVTIDQSSSIGSLLSEQAVAQFQELSKTPRLQPPNWTKSKLRHNLLLKLGIPINLDELAETGGSINAKPESLRRKSISESDIDWSRFDIPDIDSLNLTQEAQQDFINNSAEILSRIETENMSNTSELYLQKSSPETLDDKLKQMQDNYEQLLQLSSIWQGQIEDLKASQNVFESVVQNMVGYNQKIQRNELLESLRRSKTKRGKKAF
ncbi:hypothetical protein JCM33374_g2524 [Metschnikowia sp. JCM 33374]|nr:hypothetical protein JCM33374_g2524 [Metschnikowia sp. JCM 33374]